MNADFLVSSSNRGFRIRLRPIFISGKFYQVFNKTMIL